MRPASIPKNTSRRDVKLAAAIVRRRPSAAGVALRVVIEAKRCEHLSLSECCALMDQETFWRNIFGCDHRAPWAHCHEKVTKAKVQELVRHVLAGGTSNGVGDSQLTWIGYVQEANRDGGAHVRRVNIATGLNILDGHVRRHGWRGGCQSYNSGSPRGAPAYANSMERFKDDWHHYLAGRGLA